VRHSVASVVADSVAVAVLRALVGRGEIVVESRVGVDRRELVPRHTTVERPRHLDVVFAVPVVLPHDVQVVVLAVVLRDPRIVVRADERTWNALLRASSEVALRLPGGYVVADLDRRVAVEVGRSRGRAAARR